VFLGLTKRSISGDVHTYTNVINCAVRCGKLPEALDFFEEMKAKELEPNVVTLTVLMKGFCEAGDVKGAKQLFDQETSSKAGLVPNLRTVNTLLRGCVRCGGHLSTATETFAKLKTWGLEPDESCLTAVVGLLCRALQFDTAKSLLDAYASDSGLPALSTGLLVPAAHLSLATCGALLGDRWLAVTAALDDAERALEASEAQALDSKILERFESHRKIDAAAENGASDSKPTEKKRGCKKGAAKEGEASTAGFEVDMFGNVRARDTGMKSSKRQSVKLFEAHRGDEIRLEIEDLRRLCVEKQNLRAPAGQASKRAGVAYAETLKRVLPLGVGADDSGNAGSTAARTAQRLAQDFGLGEVAAAAGPKAAARVAAHLEACFDPDSGCIDFDALFPPAPPQDLQLASAGRGGAPFARTARGAPVKMELASGHGEWAAAQAREDPAARWVCVELRHDRVAATAARMHLQGLANLAAVGPVDAGRLLGKFVAPGSVDEVFVNHPEPPERTGEFAGQGAHLLTDAFFAKVARALKPKGTCTIVTDNMAYALALARSVAARDDLGSARLLRRGPHYQDLHETVGGVKVWVGQPGAECGHVKRASSFFDRMWTKGQKTKRFTLFLENQAQES